jgi:hypothetical protein
MAFGQHPGRPASARQLQQLTELIHAAGHTDFRDARGPLGLTQRQAGGRFTSDEAEVLIAQLEGEVEDAGAVRAEGETAVRAAAVGRHRGTAEAARLATIPAEVLAAELQRRGWVVLEP